MGARETLGRGPRASVTALSGHGGGLGEQRVLLGVAGAARQHEHGAGGFAHQAPGDAADHDGVHRAVAAGADEQAVELLGRLGEDVRRVADAEVGFDLGAGRDLRDGRLELPGGALVQRVVVRSHAAHFSAGQLWLTLVAEAAIPRFVIGLYVMQRPQIGRLGRRSAFAYAYSYVFFTGTVVYALVDGTGDYNALSDDLRPWMTIRGAIMVLAGLCFGYAVIRARVLPRWTAIALMTGVVLVSISQNLPEGAQLVAAAIRDLGFAGMGGALLRAGAVSAGQLEATP